MAVLCILFSFLAMIIKVALVFIFILLCRLTIPRIKLEALTKMGWKGVLSTLLVSFVFFSLGFLLFIKCAAFPLAPDWQ